MRPSKHGDTDLPDSGLGRPLMHLLCGGVLFALAALRPTFAAAQQAAGSVPAVASSQQAGDADGEANTGDDYVQPPKNLFQLLYQFKTAPGTGSAPGANGVVTTDTANLRVDHRIDFAPQWELGLRADLPFLAKNPVSSNNPDGDYLYGVGDVDTQAALIYKFDARWTVGFGARLYAPTGGALGAGRWQLMPGAAVRYALPEISAGSYLEPLLRYDASFAGDPSRKNISTLQFAPTFNLALPERWFVTFFPSAEVPSAICVGIGLRRSPAI